MGYSFLRSADQSARSQCKACLHRETELCHATMTQHLIFFSATKGKPHAAPRRTRQKCRSLWGGPTKHSALYSIMASIDAKNKPTLCMPTPNSIRHECQQACRSPRKRNPIFGTHVTCIRHKRNLQMPNFKFQVICLFKFLVSIQCEHWGGSKSGYFFMQSARMN
jgi:hypothetical protein